MRLVFAVGALLALAVPAAAQSAIVVGPSSALAWEQNSPVAGFTAAMAQSLTYAITLDGVLQPALVGVTCTTVPPVAPDLSANACKVPAAVLPLGSHSITMTAASGAAVSLPSAPLAFLDIVIPIPKNLRIQ